MNVDNSSDRIPDIYKYETHSKTEKQLKFTKQKEQRNLKRDDEYRQLGIPFETHKVGGNQLCRK